MARKHMKGRGKIKGKGIKQTLRDEAQRAKNRKNCKRTPTKAAKKALKEAERELEEAEAGVRPMQVDRPTELAAPVVEGPKLTKKEAKKLAATEYKHRQLYSAKDRVLLVGEGNFSFARALCQVLGKEADVIASCYDSEKTLALKYEDAAATRKEIEEQLGGTTLTGVDATKLHKLKDFRQAMDKIVWNFPHIGGGETNMEKSVADHQVLLAGFFKSAVQCMKPEADSRIHVALKTGEPYKSWKIVQTAAAGAPELELVKVEDFSTTAWPGYAHRRTAGFDERFSKADSEELAKGARVYVFKLGAPKDGESE